MEADGKATELDAVAGVEALAIMDGLAVDKGTGEAAEILDVVDALQIEDLDVPPGGILGGHADVATRATANDGHPFPQRELPAPFHLAQDRHATPLYAFGN